MTRKPTSSAFARAPRRARVGHQRQTFLLLRELLADPAFATLGSPTQAALLAAVITYADADGKFWPKAEVLGRILGRTSRSTRHALEGAAAAGLLRKEPYLRPDGKRGSNTFYVNRELVTRAEETFLACPNGKEPSAGQDEKEPSAGQDGKNPSGLNEISNEISNGSGKHLERDICLSPKCRKVLGDNEYVYCSSCLEGEPLQEAAA